MSSIYNYRRRFTLKRRQDRIIDLGNAGSFAEIPYINCTPADEISIDGRVFRSFHVITFHKNTRIFTAYRSDDEPAVLLIIWEEIPFYLQIEQGGDVMLQVMHDDPRVKHLIIDNTFVKSPWMGEQRTLDYMKDGWLPGLIQLELKGFCHLQAERSLGKMSFDQFGVFMKSAVGEISVKIGRKPFSYYPVRSSGMSREGSIDNDARNAALVKALRLVRSSE